MKLTVTEFKHLVKSKCNHSLSHSNSSMVVLVYLKQYVIEYKTKKKFSTGIDLYQGRRESEVQQKLTENQIIYIQDQEDL